MSVILKGKCARGGARGAFLCLRQNFSSPVLERKGKERESVLSAPTAGEGRGAAREVAERERTTERQTGADEIHNLDPMRCSLLSCAESSSFGIHCYL